MIQTPKDLYAPSPSGCAISLISAAGFAGGFYHGFNDSLGRPMSPRLENVLMYAPAILGSLVGPAAMSRIYNHPGVIAQLPPMPKEARGCASGCFGIPAGAGLAAASTYVGYLIGGFVGNASK